MKNILRSIQELVGYYSLHAGTQVLVNEEDCTLTIPDCVCVPTEIEAGTRMTLGEFMERVNNAIRNEETGDYEESSTLLDMELVDEGKVVYYGLLN